MSHLKLISCLSPYIEKITAILLFFGFFIFFIWCGISGVNFGFHWDEFNLIRSVLRSAQSGILVPTWYNYPSLSYVVLVITTLGEAIFNTHIDLNVPNGDKLLVQHLNQHIVDFLTAQNGKLLFRRVFICLSASTAFFIAIAARLTGVTWISASIAGVIVLSSYQVFYHARWIAPDTLLMLTSSMALAAGLWALKTNGYKALVVSSLCAGLAVAAKYPGGMLILLPLYATIFNQQKAKRILLVLIVFFNTFIFITPGILVQPFSFIKDVRHEMIHYKTGHGLHTIESGWTHFQKIAEFLSFRLISPNAFLSFLFLILAVIGAFFLWQRNKRYAVILLVISIGYMAYFASQKVMIIRNLLILVPFMALFVSMAIDSITIRLQATYYHFAMPVVIIVLCLFNLHYFLYNTQSIKTGSNNWEKAVEAYISENADKRMSISDQLLALLPASSKAKIFYPKDQADVYIYTLAERKEACANQRNAYQVIAGPNDVDLDYYPDWEGQNRVVELNLHVCH